MRRRNSSAWQDQTYENASRSQLAVGERSPFAASWRGADDSLALLAATVRCAVIDVMKRRLATILVGDVVGYSAMMEADEEGTAARVAEVAEMIRAKVSARDGRVFKTMGDSVLAEFGSPLNALRCAVDIRGALAETAVNEIRMRFGLHLADVIEAGSDLIGDGVNVAARIEQRAEPGTIDISGTLFEQVRRNSPFSFEPLGERRFKNISEPVTIYRLRGEQDTYVFQTVPTKENPQREKRPYSIAVVPLSVSANADDVRFLADGVTDDLILELGRFRRLFVSSRTASAVLHGAVPDPVAIGTRSASAMFSRECCGSSASACG